MLEMQINVEGIFHRLFTTIQIFANPVKTRTKYLVIVNVKRAEHCVADLNIPWVRDRWRHIRPKISDVGETRAALLYTPS